MLEAPDPLLLGHTVVHLGLAHALEGLAQGTQRLVVVLVLVYLNLRGGMGSSWSMNRSGDCLFRLRVIGEFWHLFIYFNI